MEKTIDESKQGNALILEQKENNSKKLFIESYGCAMNFSDSEIVASILAQARLQYNNKIRRSRFSFSKHLLY